MTKVWYENTGDPNPTYFADEDSASVRPGEHFFLSDIPRELRTDIYTITWSGATPTLVRNASADQEIAGRSRDFLFEAINRQNALENKKDFGFDGHNYYSDKDSIQSVQNQCLVMDDADSIPVPNGVWKSEEKESDGVTPVYVAMTVAEFKLFATAFFNRSSGNFGVKEFHKHTIDTLYLQGDSDGILDYDYSTGWQ